MKKRLALLLALCMLPALAACGHTHTWAEATCTAPKTCTECGETEGEPLGHTWTEASCTAPKTCSVCGETEGAPLGHKPTEANYQEGSVCSVCGEQLSQPLEAAFVTYDLEQYVHPLGTDEVFRYQTCGYTTGTRTRLPEYDAVANVETYELVLLDEDDKVLWDKWSPGDGRVMGIQAEEGMKDVVAWIEERAGEGYEWKGAWIRVDFTDYDHGYSASSCLEDYYDIVGHDESMKDHEVSTADGTRNVREYTVSDHGEARPAYVYTENEGYGNGWVVFKDFFYVPEGYDGCVVGLLDGELQPDGWAEGCYVFDYANENTLLFRLK